MVFAAARAVDGDWRHVEVAVVVADRWQGQGLGSRLLQLLVEVARDEKLERITGEIKSRSNG